MNLLKKPSAIQLNQSMLHYKDTSYSWTELNTDNNKIGSWGRDLLGMQFKNLFPFFFGLSAPIPSSDSHPPDPINDLCPLTAVGEQFELPISQL